MISYSKNLKNGLSVEVSHVFPIRDRTEVSAYLRKVADNSIELGVCSPNISWNEATTGAVYLTHDGEFVGIIAYQSKVIYAYEKRLIQITLGGVEEKFRSLGAYSILHKELERVAQSYSVDGILSYVRSNNKRMINTLDNLKKEVVSVVCVKEIEKLEESRRIESPMPTTPHQNPITYHLEDDNMVVTYESPSRKFGNLREELNNDAVRINREHGKVYVAFSTGVDSQVMLRCFLDMNCDFEPFFLYVKGLNDFEHRMLVKSENFYGIKIKVLEIDIEQYKEEWLQRKVDENLVTLVHNPLEWACAHLPEDWPVIMSGANEPSIVGTRETGMHIYHNYYESLLLRFRLLGQHRLIFDFPYSAESLASFYCDDLIKTWQHVSNYYIHNDLVSKKTGKKPSPGSRFNYYLKGLMKGRYFKNDIMWPIKKTGFERFPKWTVPSWVYPQKYNVTVNYDELVEHLEACSGTLKDFRGCFF